MFLEAFHTLKMFNGLIQDVFKNYLSAKVHWILKKETERALVLLFRDAGYIKRKKIPEEDILVDLTHGTKKNPSFTPLHWSIKATTG